jgi:hypothetical protein
MPQGWDWVVWGVGLFLALATWVVMAEARRRFHLQRMIAQHRKTNASSEFQSESQENK